jgi:trehalose 6-phosphate phosphatase
VKVANILKAVVFDLDGVITHTARVHAAAWKELFDDFLRDINRQSGKRFEPFTDNDYARYVDGKPRIDGVVSFLTAYGIQIPLGSPADSPLAETAWGLGNRKNRLFVRKLQEMGVDVDREAVRFVRELRAKDIITGLASSSENAVLILERVQLRSLFDAVVDGIVSQRLNLRGKPAPDIFLQCLAELSPSAQPRDAAIVEDAISGVEAGKRGRFGFVLGVDRGGTRDLQRHGADCVIRSFAGLRAGQFTELFEGRIQAA